MANNDKNEPIGGKIYDDYQPGDKPKFGVGHQAKVYSPVDSSLAKEFADKNIRHQVTQDELDESYKQDIRTIYSPEQVNAIDGAMGGARGTLGSTRGGTSSAAEDNMIDNFDTINEND